MNLVLKRTLLFFIITLLLLNSFIISISGYGNTISTDIDSLSYRQKIEIPIDTSKDEAKYKPIDIRVDFDNDCWAINQTKHSVRVGFTDGSDLIEIESQIYDLEFTSSGSSNIISCSLVFLIPEQANGQEEYYILYDGSETNSPEYVDHLKVEDTHYFYEPISGQIIDFDYYKIIEDDYVIYGICQEGELLGNGMSNSVIKLKPNSTEFETVNAEQIASFSMSYSINPSGEHTGTQWAKDVSKNIIEDGNLMIRLQIGGLATNNEIETDNIYTYYYSPIPTKILNVNVNHKVLKSIEIEGNKEREGVYASLSTIKARSATIEKMNIGDILPKIHFHSEYGNIKEYSMPVDPDADPAEWILSAVDDEDLGSEAWMCIDDPSSGQSHGLIFESNTGFLNDDNDGIQIKASVHQHVNLPGLEADSGDLFAIRNAYENGNHDTVINEGIEVVFNIEFMTTQNGGYSEVQKESVIFQKLIGDRPIFRENVTYDVEEEKERYGLTVYIHRARSFPMGSLLSAGLGRNISYILAELYKDDSFTSSGSASRLSMGSIDLDFENTTLIQKIRLGLGLFDWRNLSLFKKIRFPDLEVGRYLIKIYRENPSRGRDRQYIGFAVVDVDEEKSVRIYCKPEGEADLSVFDQNENGIKDVNFLLLSDEIVISKEITSEEGSVVLKAPCYRNPPYVLQVIYQGFLVDEKEIRFGLKNSIFSYKDTFSMPLYRLELRVKDTLDLTPSVDLNPILTSSEMVDQSMIPMQNKGDGIYEISNLYSSNYLIKLSFKSFVYEEEINIDSDKIIDIQFPAEFSVDINCMNSFGYSLEEGDITLKREGKTISSNIGSDGYSNVKIPPGIYNMMITINNEEIANQDIEIKGNKILNIITSEGSFLHSLGILIGIIVIVFSFVLIFLKRNYIDGLKLIGISLIIVSIFLPWWVLTGDNGTIITTTNTYLIPSKIITLTSTQAIFGGEISAVPPEFTMVLEILTMILLLVILLIAINIILKNRFKRITSIISIISIIMVLLSIVLFYVAMSEVTNVGVGSFSDSGELSVSVPGVTENVLIECNWGLGLGLILAFFGFISISFFTFLNIFQKIKKKILK